MFDDDRECDSLSVPSQTGQIRRTSRATGGRILRPCRSCRRSPRDDRAGSVPCRSVTASRMKRPSCRAAAGSRIGFGSRGHGVVLLDKRRPQAAIGGDRRGDRRHSQRRGHHLRLAVPDLRQRLPDASARSCDSGVSDILKLIGERHERIGPEAHRQLREVGVARVDEPVVHVDRPVRVRIEHIVPHRPGPTADSGADAAVRQTRAREASVASAPAPQRRQRDDELERRAWRIRAVPRPIEPDVRRVVCRRCRRVRRSWPGIARARQDGAGIRVEHDGCRLALRLPRVAGDDRRDAQLQVARRSSACTSRERFMNATTAACSGW